MVSVSVVSIYSITTVIAHSLLLLFIIYCAWTCPTCHWNLISTVAYSLSDHGFRRANSRCLLFFFFQAEDGIRDLTVTGVQTCALPISDRPDVTNGTHIVDIGLLQIEIGGLYTHATAGEHAAGTPMTARVGLTEWLEARIDRKSVV